MFQSFFVVVVKENWIYATTRHHAEPNINILLKRNLPFDPDVRESSHPLTLFRMRGGAKMPPTSFLPVTSANVGISPF